MRADYESGGHGSSPRVLMTYADRDSVSDRLAQSVMDALGKVVRVLTDAQSVLLDLRPRGRNGRCSALAGIETGYNVEGKHRDDYKQPMGTE